MRERKAASGCCLVTEYGWNSPNGIIWLPWNLWWFEDPEFVFAEDGRKCINSADYSEPDWERLECGCERRVPVRGRKYYNRSRKCFIRKESA
jgi:hypothetical protein